MASLLDIPVFSKLGRVCNQHNLDITLFGGAVTRLVKAAGGNDLTSAVLNDFDDLFALAPPFSDFDISHSGSPSQNALIQRAILDFVPNGECFRWDIRARSEWAIYEAAARYNNRIPARQMSLSTNPQSGFQDPLNGRADIKAGMYRYERNSAYGHSPLFLQIRDLELFSALIYLITVFEDQAVKGRSDQPGFGTVAQVLTDARTLETIISLQESSYLRARFHYLVAMLATLDAPKDSLEQVKLPLLLQFLEEQFPSFRTRLQQIEQGATQEGAAVISSARIGGDFFRLPVLAAPWSQGEQSRTAFEKALSENVTLGGNEIVVLGSPWMKVTRGIAESNASSGGQDRASLIQEFVYFNLKNQNRLSTPDGPVCTDGSLHFRAEDLTLFLALRTCHNNKSTVLPLAGDVYLKPERMLIRINAWALFEELSSAEQPEVQLFVSGWDA
ncbi:MULTISPECIES: hypothetical protein [unclassified Bradyrhizobium]